MPRGKKNINWKVGDIFIVAQDDCGYSFGQIVGEEPKALNSVICAFYDMRCDDFESAPSCEGIRKDRLISIQFITRDLLDYGEWKIVSWRKPIEVGQTKLIKNSRRKHFVGTKIIGSGIMCKFLNAFYGLHPWDACHDPNYFDNLLVDLSKRPSRDRLIFKP